MKRRKTLTGLAVVAGAGLLWGALAAAAGAAADAGTQGSDQPTGARNSVESGPDKGDTVKRGAYLATAGDCIACHSASKQAAPYAGGLPMNSPFGTIYSTNITPDPETGIGRYTLDDFSQALRHGRRLDGARLYPAMPYASYAAMTDADIADLYAYFMHEVKPVKHVPPQTALPFPFNQRWALYFWDAAFVKHEVFKPRDDRSVEWNRGAYLVQTLGHCGSCHTPRGPGYEERGYDESSPHFLTGAVVDHWYAADLSGNRASGIGRRSQADIVQLLRSGQGAGDAIFGSMRDVVERSTQYLGQTDLEAIALYLKSLPGRGDSASYRQLQGRISTAAVASAAPTVPVLAMPAVASMPAASTAPPSASSASSPTTALAAPTSSARTAPETLAVAVLRERPGAGIYNGFCLKCHGADGSGKPGKFPALAGNPALLLPNPSSLIRLLVEGIKAPQTAQVPKPEAMPAFGHTLRDADLADVLTYVRSSWGNHAAPVTVHTVATQHASIVRDRLKGATQPAN